MGYGERAKFGRAINKMVREGEVSFRNVPSFVYAEDQSLEVPGIGDLRYDVAFGGAFYAFIRSEDVGVTLERDDFHALIDMGMKIKRAVMSHLPIHHPFEKDLGFLYGTIFVGPPRDPAHHSRNVCIFADGQVDRCPTGTGVSGRLAIHYERGELCVNEPIVVESIVGTRFGGRIVETTTCGPHPAIIPEVEGSAYITGRHEFLLDPADPLREGFILR